MGIAAAIGVFLPFPFDHWLWCYPQTWVELYGKGPMQSDGLCGSFLEADSVPLFFSVCTFSWPPLLYLWPLFAFGQFLNFSLDWITWSPTFPKTRPADGPRSARRGPRRTANFVVEEDLKRLGKRL